MTTDRGGAATACYRAAKLYHLLWWLLLGCLLTVATSDQCLSQLSHCVCSHASGSKRFEMARKYLLPYCYQYTLWSVLDTSMVGGIGRSSQQCYFYLDHILFLDDMVARFVAEFEDILRKYDCSQTFSVQSNCQKCKEAYRQWTCSMMLPLWKGNRRVKPCRNVCHEVERLCPYFLPAEKTGPGSQYAGEPSFLCIGKDIEAKIQIADPDVQETGHQSANSFFSDESECYRPCSELNTDSADAVDRKHCVPKSDVQLAETFTSDCAGNFNNINVSKCNVPSDEARHIDGDPRSGGNSESASASVQTAFLQFGWKWRTATLSWLLLLLRTVLSLLT